MSSVNVRYWRGAWVVDLSTKIAGKRQRSIKTFGAGAKAKAAAQAYAEEIAPQAKTGKYWERQAATFADLWEKFATHELSSPDLRPSTVADYKALGRLYLVPYLGDRLLSEIDTETILDMKASLQAQAGAKAAGKEGSGKPLSPRSVAKILILGGSVWRYGRRIKMVDGSPFADVRKPRAAKREPYILDAAEIAKLRTALDIPFERLLIELTLTTGMRSGEVRGLTWDSIDLEGKRLFIERQANRRGEEAATKTESSVRPIPVPAYLIPELKRWKLACPVTARGLVFPGEPNAQGERNPIDADILLRHILRRALRRAGLPPLRFHDLRHMAGTLMHEAGVPLKRAQEILGHASERTTLAIYTHSMRRTHDDSADKIAALAGLSAPSSDLGNKVETSNSVESQEASVSDCFSGSPGRIRTADQRINSPSLYH
jgi:integrase